jgi:hypothetical protein
MEVKYVSTYITAEISNRTQSGYPFLLSNRAGNLLLSGKNENLLFSYRTIVYNTTQHVRKRLNPKLEICTSCESIMGLYAEGIHKTLNNMQSMFEQLFVNTPELRIEAYFNLGNKSIENVKSSILDFFEKIQLLKSPLSKILRVVTDYKKKIEFCLLSLSDSTFSSNLIILSLYEMYLDATFCRLKLTDSLKKYNRGFGLNKEDFEFPAPLLIKSMLPKYNVLKI